MEYDAERQGVAPSRWLVLLETRAPFEYAVMATTAPILSRLGRGDGHPVMVLPGFAADDRSTKPLRGILRNQGYRAHGWRLGSNTGPTTEIVEGVAERLLDLHRQSGRTVSLIGWSLGGIYARELAREHSHAVRQVITLGSPFRRVEDDRSDPAPLTVPATSIYTRTDGIVQWRTCLEADGPERENIEVTGSHCGLGYNPAVVVAVSDRLRQPEGEWRPFQPTLLQRPMFPMPARRNRAA